MHPNATSPPRRRASVGRRTAPRRGHSSRERRRTTGKAAQPRGGVASWTRNHRRAATITQMDEAQHRVAIIGAGPIGLELAVAFKRAGIDYVHFDAGQIGSTIEWYPIDMLF